MEQFDFVKSSSILDPATGQDRTDVVINVVWMAGKCSPANLHDSKPGLNAGHITVRMMADAHQNDSLLNTTHEQWDCSQRYESGF